MTRTTTKAVSVDLNAIFRRFALSYPSVNPMKMGVLTMGFMTAKKPAKTARLNGISCSGIAYSQG
jgi:hypothetical protein